VALVPIRVKERIVGLIQFNDKHKGRFDLDTVELLEVIAANIGSTLLRKRLEDEKVLLERQFQQAQKLESLGVLAGGIAHDFNNILAIIIGYCALVKMDYETTEEYIPYIETAAQRAAALCRQMLAYAGKAQSVLAQVDMTEVVNEMVTMLKATTSQNVSIRADLPAAMPYINGDVSQLRQVVMNLIINASEAIGDNQGVVNVSLARTEIQVMQSEKDHNGVIIPAGSYVCLEVTDNGCGMDNETRQRMFEPFYTTKFSGRGLGMSALLGIITAHKGALQLSSQPGHGTTFKVYLPVQINVAEEGLPQQAAQAPWKGSGTILLAEDEEQVLFIGKAILKAMGFAVIGAANGKEALELYQQNSADITLVVTDMGMPVMNGYELFYKLKKINPELPIIISSGFGDSDVTSRIPREEIAGLINKPYSPEQLRDVLKGVVEGAESISHRTR
jgi:signal transduction histidine kinase/CheY-like chemotaxis protein